MRKLSTDEKKLIETLLTQKKEDYSQILLSLKDLTIEELNDEGMGSLQFISKEKQKLVKTISEAEFIDEDGVPVFLALGIDAEGKLFELDVWKADFSPVKKWPPIKDISVKEHI